MTQNFYQSRLEVFYRHNSRMPTYSEMLSLFGFKSKNAVAKLVQKLIEAGIVRKDHLGRLIPGGTFGEIPKLGLVTAGLPMDVTEELKDTVNLDELLIGNKEFTYLLEVDGDSMIEAHIKKGDLVLVERVNNNARDGQIVIAEVDGEYTMKYFRVKGGRRYLEPANKDYKPIYPKYSLTVLATVKAVLRKY